MHEEIISYLCNHFKKRKKENWMWESVRESDILSDFALIFIYCKILSFLTYQGSIQVLFFRAHFCEKNTFIFLWIFSLCKIFSQQSSCFLKSSIMFCLPSYIAIICHIILYNILHNILFFGVKRQFLHIWNLWRQILHSVILWRDYFLEM